MKQTSFRSVDEYIAKQPKEVRPVLERVRGIIRKAMPGAVEAISYQIPAYKLPGGGALYFGGWNEHYSVYAGTEFVAMFRKELAPYEIRKGTVRFPFSKPVPAKLIADIAKFHAKKAAKAGKK